MQSPFVTCPTITRWVAEKGRRRRQPDSRAHCSLCLTEHAVCSRPVFQKLYTHDCLQCLYLAVCWVSLLTLTRALWSVLPPSVKVRQRRPGERAASVASTAVARLLQKLLCPDPSPLGMVGVWGVGEKAGQRVDLNHERKSLGGIIMKEQSFPSALRTEKLYSSGIFNKIL